MFEIERGTRDSNIKWSLMSQVFRSRRAEILSVVQNLKRIFLVFFNTIFSESGFNLDSFECRFEIPLGAISRYLRLLTSQNNFVLSIGKVLSL